MTGTGGPPRRVYALSANGQRTIRAADRIQVLGASLRRVLQDGKVRSASGVLTDAARRTTSLDDSRGVSRGGSTR